MHTAHEMAGTWPGPVLIGGDLNHPLDTFEIWPILQKKGWKSIHDLHSATNLSPLPATYKDNTYNDTLLVSPELHHLFLKAEVIKDSGLPDHHPIS